MTACRVSPSPANDLTLNFGTKILAEQIKRAPENAERQANDGQRQNAPAGKLVLQAEDFIHTKRGSSQVSAQSHW